MKPAESLPHAEPVEGRTTLPATGSGQSGLQFSRRVQLAQAFILLMVITYPGAISLRLACVADSDVWWHLRTAEWILQHRAIPRADAPLFSIPGSGTNWASYSWLFEILVGKLFQWLGLTGVVALTTTMAVVIATALHRLIRNLQSDFTITALLTFVAGFSLTRLYTPRPWLFTILFFALELDLLMQARKTGKLRGLLWLPVLFALWPNLHIQFVDGLVVLAFALAEALLSLWWTGHQSRIRPSWMCGISVACILATMANPYGWKIYKYAYDLAVQPGVLKNVTESQALPFRTLGDWCVLLLALASAAVLARARKFAFFESALLTFAVYVSFRSQRDVWVVVIVACAILAAGLEGNDANRTRLTLSAAPIFALASTLALLVGFRVLHVNNVRLSSNLAESLPVRAVEVVKQKGWSGPLYNDFNWGGYLIWALRMPVGIDGRSALYGDERIDRIMATWNAQPGWASDPDLAKAGLVIAPVTMPLTQLLRVDPRFQLTYEDKLAAVFVARKSLSQAPTEINKVAVHADVK